MAPTRDRVGIFPQPFKVARPPPVAFSPAATPASLPQPFTGPPTQSLTSMDAASPAAPAATGLNGSPALELLFPRQALRPIRSRPPPRQRPAQSHRRLFRHRMVHRRFRHLLPLVVRQD